MTPTAVRVRGLRKRYGDRDAVDGLDLDVARGECLAILGPNGAGKTTTVEILEGHRRRDDGEVSVLGVDPERADAEWRSRVGLVLQTSGLHDELTVRELVRHTARYYPAGRTADEAIALVGLQEKADDRIKRLSGGQQRRLDVALGIVGRPELLFLDEPTTGFDPEARHQFWAMITGLHRDGTTILLTTHYLDEADALAERVVVVNNGRVVATDTPDGLRRRAGDQAVVRWHDSDGAHEIATTTPGRVVSDVVARGGEPVGLTVSRPTLEDVYLDLIGATR